MRKISHQQIYIKIRSRTLFWWKWLDLNQQSSDYQSNALTVRPHFHLETGTRFALASTDLQSVTYLLCQPVKIPTPCFVFSKKNAATQQSFLPKVKILPLSNLFLIFLYWRKAQDSNLYVFYHNCLANSFFTISEQLSIMVWKIGLEPMTICL